MANRVLCFIVVLVAIYVSSAFPLIPTASAASPEDDIRAVLESGAKGWNIGDLDMYLAVYTEDATEMLSTGPAGGKSRIGQTMRDGFWKTGRPVQKLRYDHIDVRMLGSANALVTGQFILSGADKPDRTGWFTTIWKKTPDGWRIIHDHS